MVYNFPPILLIVFGLLLVFAFFLLKSKERPEPNYRALFALGFAFLPVGIALENYLFSLLGFAYIAIALVNKDKWKEHKPPEGGQKILIIGLLVVTLLLVLLTFILRYL